MRTKDIVIGADYLVSTWRARNVKGTVTAIRPAHMKGSRPSIGVKFISKDGYERTDALSPAAVLRPWDEQLEAAHQERLAREAEAQALRNRIESTLDVRRVHVSTTGDVTLYLTRAQIEALL